MVVLISPNKSQYEHLFITNFTYFLKSLLKSVFNSLRLEHCSKMEVTVDQHASSGCLYYNMTGSTRCGPTSSAVGYSANSTTTFSLPTPLFSLANSSNNKQQYSLSSSSNGTTKSSHLSLLNLNNSISSSFSANSAVSLPSPTLPQYTNLSDSGHASSMYNFEDYHGAAAALPFPSKLIFSFQYFSNNTFFSPQPRMEHHQPRSDKSPPPPVFRR